MVKVALVGYCNVMVAVRDCNVVIVVLAFCKCVVCDCCRSAIVEVMLFSWYSVIG